ncbi:MAG TPA: phytanoyl-CoA dioxygenase family protein [Caulobacteraceae bacterium]
MTLTGTLTAEPQTQEIVHRAFWEENFPNLAINSRLAGAAVEQTALSAAELSRAGERMREEGYFQAKDATLARLAPVLAEAVITCKRLDIPPAFIFIFDEVWECFQALHPVLSAFLGADYKALPDFWTWHVDPKAGESGWRPHRDKGRVSLAPDGSPLSFSVWIPFTEAMPQNGCMYILPANRDPVYNTAEEGQWRIDIARVRALPARPGEFLVWDQALLHWGAESSRFAPHPRISVAMEFQRGDIRPFNQPLSEPFANHSFEMRLKLVAKQILQYKHMYPLAARFETLAQGLLAS